MFKSNENRLVWGTASFGTGISSQASFSIIDAYLDAGGSIIDTTAVYGMGIFEQTVGE